MANPAPTITTINAFSASAGTIINFNIIGGTEIVRSNKIYIYDLATNDLICTHLAVTTEPIHELPANTDESIVYETGKTSEDFTNGHQYYAQIQTFTDTTGTSGASGLSSAKVFWCLPLPTLSITYPSSSIPTTSCNAQATYNTNAPSGVINAAQQYKFTLYDASGQQLQTSGIISGSGSQVGTSTTYNINYNFLGLEYNQTYYIIVEMTTSEGMTLSQRSSNFVISTSPTTLPQATVINDGCNGYISVVSNMSGSYSSSIKRVLVKRLDVDDVTGKWVTLFGKVINQASDMNFTFVDFFNRHGKTYQYAIVPVLTQQQSGITVEIEGGYTRSATVDSFFDGVFITDGIGTQRLKAGVGYESMEYNQAVGVHPTIGGKYPIVVMNSNTGYHSGALSAQVLPERFYTRTGEAVTPSYAYILTSTFGRLCTQSGDPLVAELKVQDVLNRMDMVEQRKILEKFLTNKRPKVIKDWNGNIWLVMFVDNIDTSFDNSWGMGMATITGNWVEVGDPNDENDLYDMGLIKLGGVSNYAYTSTI